MHVRYMFTLLLGAAVTLVLITAFFRLLSGGQGAENSSHTRSPSPRNNTQMLQELQNRIKTEKVTMIDPGMLEVLQNVISPPGKVAERQVTNDGGHTSQHGQPGVVDKLLEQRKNGFFVECGASDGVTYSNTLFFEMQRNWTGLLVEVNPNFYRELVKKKRNAYSINACLSPSKSPQLLKFRPFNFIGGLSDFMEPSHLKVAPRFLDITGIAEINAICYPLYSVMLALERSHIDYFSLDVEGAELQILETIPFDKLFIDAISVEYSVEGSKEATERKLAKIRQFFNETKLYKEAALLLNQDAVFKRITT